MNTIVYLIRHGEVEYKYDSKGRKLIYGRDGYLSHEGEKQITRLAQKLKKEAVYRFVHPFRNFRNYESL